MLLTVPHALWAANQIVYVDQPTGNNSDSCLTEALACATLAGAYGKIAGSGNTIRVCNGTTHRVTDVMTITSAKSGTAAAHNTVEGYNCTSIRNAPVSWPSSVPIVTHMALVTGWTLHQTLTGGLSIWKATQGVNTYANVLQDVDMIGQSHKDYTCTYNAATPSTHSDFKNCWPGIRYIWHNQTNSLPSLSNCPTNLQPLIHHFCYNPQGAGTLYLVAPSDPDTYYVNPGVEALNRSPNGGHFVLLNGAAFWDFKNLSFRGPANKALQSQSTSAVGDTHDILIENVRMGFSIRRPVNGNASCNGCGISEGASIMDFAADSGQQAYNVTMRNVIWHDTGRAGMELSNPGNIHDITWDTIEAYNTFTHEALGFNHQGVAATGLRSNLVVTNANFHDNCQDIGTGSGGNGQGAYTATVTNMYSHDSLQGDTDTRIGWFLNGGVPNASCNNLVMGPVYHDSPNSGAQITFTRLLATRNQRGPILKGPGKLTINNSTIANNTLTGVQSVVNNGEVEINGSIIANNGAGVASSTTYELGVQQAATGTVWSGGNTANTRNVVFRNNASAFRCNGAAVNLAGWQACTNVTGHDSTTFEDPVFDGAATGNYNLASTSPVDEILTSVPFCGAAGELGALERPAGQGNGITIDACTWQVPVCSQLTPVTVDCTKVIPQINHGGCTDCTICPSVCGTASNCMVDAGGSSFTFTPSTCAQNGQTLRVLRNDDAVKSAPLGGTGGVRAENVFGTTVITNTVPASTSPPVFAGCTIPNLATPNQFQVTVTPNGGTMTPTSGITGFTMSGKTLSGNCTSSGSTATCTVTVNFAAGATHTVSYSQGTGNWTNGTDELTAFTNQPCLNQVTPPGGIEYFVSTAGNDTTNDCMAARTSGATAKRNIATASGGLSCLGPGDILTIASGTYPETLTAIPSGLGSFGAATIIRAATPGGVTVQRLALSGKSWIIVNGLVFDGTGVSGSFGELVSLANTTHHVRLTGVEVKNSPHQGIYIPAIGNDNNEILNSLIHNNGTTLGQDHGLYIAGNTTTVSGNQIYSNLAYGVQVYLAAGGLTGTTLTRNVIYNNGTGASSTHAGILLSSGTAHSATNNILYGNPYGIRLAFNATSNTVYNNTIYGNTFYGIEVSTPTANNLVKNNIVYGNTSGSITNSGTCTTFATNLCTGVTTGCALSGDPLFVNTATHDFHLQTTSPAKNTGTTIASVTTDYDGVIRPVGANYDIGAFEYNTPDTSPPTVLSCTPSGQLPIGTTSTALACTTNENATCKWNDTDVAYASMANTFSGAGTTSQTSTKSSLTNNSTYTVYVRCQDAEPNVMTTSFVMNFSVAGVPAGPQTYYVSTAGSDANGCVPGATGVNAKRNLTGGSGAIACLSGGDTLIVQAGTYAESLTTLPSGNGSFATATTLRAQTALGATVQRLALSGKSWIVVDGLVFDGTALATSTAEVILLGSNTHHVRIINSEIKNSPQSGIHVAGVGSDNNEILTNLIHDNGLTANQDHGIRLYSNNNTIAGNQIYNNQADGVHIYLAAGGLFGNVVRNNLIYNNAGTVPGETAAGILLSSGAGTAYNNILYGNPYGVRLACGAVANTAYNNTVYGNTAYGIAFGAGSTSGEAKNNIVYANTTGSILNSGSGSTFATNLCEVSSTECAVTGDPQFVDVSTHDFHILAQSAAKNTGTTLASVTTDYEGNTRPIGANYDIGAYEFNIPDTSPPSLTLCTPSGTFVSSTSSVALACTSSEIATCKWSNTDDPYASMPNTFSGAGTTSHTSTKSGLVAGTSYTVYVRCQDPDLNTMTTSGTINFSIAAAANPPSLGLAVVQATQASTITLSLLNPSGGTITPASNPTGFAVGGHTITGMTFVAPNQYDVALSSPFVYGETTRQLCYTQGTATPVLSDTTELLGGCIDVTNNVPAPPVVPVLTQTAVQCGLAGFGQNAFTDARRTIPNATVAGLCPIPPGVTVQMKFELACSVADCELPGVVFEYCSNCTAHGSTNWTAIGDDCTTAPVCFGPDPTVTSGATVATSLTGCTIDGSVAMKTAGLPNQPLTITAGHCAVLIGVLRLGSQASPNATTVGIRVRSSDGTLLTYGTTPQFQAIPLYGSR